MTDVLAVRDVFHGVVVHELPHRAEVAVVQQVTAALAILDGEVVHLPLVPEMESESSMLCRMFCEADCEDKAMLGRNMFDDSSSNAGQRSGSDEIVKAKETDS